MKKIIISPLQGCIIKIGAFSYNHINPSGLMPKVWYDYRTVIISPFRV